MQPENVEKFPESVWRMSFYMCTWGYTYYALVFTKKYNYFHDPNSVWMSELIPSVNDTSTFQLRRYGHKWSMETAAFNLHVTWRAFSFQYD